MKTSLIIQEAKEVKQFIEKNKTLPKFCTINGNQYSIYTASLLFGKFLQNRKSTNLDVKNIQNYNTKNNYKINEKIFPNDYLDMNNRFVKYCNTYQRVPSFITTKKSKEKVSYELFVYCLCKIITFYSNNSKTLPAYCIFNSSDIQNKQNSATNTNKTTSSSTSTKTSLTKTTQQKKQTKCSNPYTSAPHYTSLGCNRLGQCTGYFCAPHAIHQAMKKFGITKYDEKTIARWAGTTTAGTGHPGINTAIAKISQETGIKFSVQWKNFSDMGSTLNERFANVAKLLCQDNIAIIWHIAYINGGNSTNGTHFGHYECLDKINTSTKFVRALNSLGERNSNGSYQGKLQNRAFDIQGYFARNTPGGQAALCIIKKG